MPDSAVASPNGNGTRARRIPPPAIGQVSRSGTHRWGDGRTLPDDHVGRLTSPTSRMALFEEMRASDEAIETPLNAREQLIKAASWTLATADDTAQAVEIQEFVEDNVYPVLDQLLEQLAGALQYGFGCCEPVFERLDAPARKQVARGRIRRATKSRGRKIYLASVANIRQRTIETFRIADDGALLFLEQWVQTNAYWRRIQVPAERVLLWTYRRRGDDYWGVPPLRSLYKAWDYSRQLQDIAVLGFDKFGIGTPVAIAGDGWADGEYEKALEYFRQWRAGEHNGLVVPPGAEIKLEGGEGTVHSALLEFVKWYALAKAKVLLTQSTELGSTETGSRALGESFVEQTEGASQSDCEQIASILNERLIVPLIDWNFGPQEEYPAFTPKQRVRNSAALAGVFSQLKSAGFKLTAQDEAWFRDQVEMPEIDVEERQAELDAQADLTRQTQEATLESTRESTRAGGQPGGRDQGRGSGGLGRGDGSRSPRALGPSYPPATGAPVRYRTREYSEWEARVVRPELVARQLDLDTVRLTAEVQDVLREIDADLERQVDRLTAGGAESLTAGVRSIVVPESLKRKLRAVMLTAARRAREYGARTVHSEIARQRGPEPIGPSRRPDVGLLSRASRFVREFALAPTTQEQLRDLLLEAEIDRAVEDEADRRERSFRTSVLTALAAAGALAAARLAEIARQAVAAALESLSPAVTQGNVAAVVNTGFGIGRHDAVDEYPRAIVTGSGSTTIIPPGRPTPVRDIPEIRDPERRPTPPATPTVPRPATPGQPGTPAPRPTEPTEPAEPRPSTPSSPTPSSPSAPVRRTRSEPDPAPETDDPILVAKIYSAVLDDGTCEECARWDGAEFPLDHPEDVRGVQAPNPRCAGGYSRCRCVWVYRTAEEAPSIVPPTRGPTT